MPSPLPGHAALLGGKPAVIEDRPGGSPTVWTFAELNREANRLANALLGLGVRPGDRVVWCGQNSPGVVRAMHALVKIGATAVPLNYRLTPEEAAYVVDDSDAVLVYADAEQAHMFARIRAQIPQVRHIVVFDGRPGPGMISGDTLMRKASDAEPPVEGTDAHPAAMLYTSGTTGRPKGAVRLPTDPALVRPLLERMGHRPDDVYLPTGPLYHSGPGGYLSIAHRLGNTAVLQRRFDAEDWLRLVATHRVSMTFSAPAPIRMVCALPAEVKARYDRTSMRRMIANAAPWSYALKEAYMADFGEDSLWEIYGSTELGVDTVLAPGDQRRKPGSCGQAAPGVEIRLLAEDGTEVTASHAPGEVFVRSAGNFVAYHKAAAAFEANRRGDFSSVGDVAYRDEEGFYYICDRKNDMIISGGMNVYPAEIEAALERHPAILEAAVFGIPSEEWGEAVHAVIVRRAGQALTVETVTGFAREHLAGYKLPRSVAFADELPRTGSGKVLKRVLREPYWQGQQTRVS
ncbi:MAG TPA: AMP-binding protein [Candidatus Limnocylindrales bacterium]|nr:AMP-binding protein [Candidatus Limnocylindrales bacterium]